jgi:DNA-binding MarR family transcriptional regulator
LHPCHRALAAPSGGSRPIWLTPLALKPEPRANRRNVEEVGVLGATLTYHLNAEEADGLVTRRTYLTNRRIHFVEPADGDALFHRLRDAANGFNARLQAGLTDADGDNPGQACATSSRTTSLPANAMVEALDLMVTLEIGVDRHKLQIFKIRSGQSTCWRRILGTTHLSTARPALRADRPLASNPTISTSPFSISWRRGA